MKKFAEVLYITIVLAILLTPLVLINRQEEAVSEIDNRTLREAPELWQDGFTKEFEAYVEDRIGFRNEMINAYAVLNDVVAHELTHPAYTYGKDGYIFSKMTDNISYNDFHKVFAEMVLKMQEYCTARGTDFYFMLEPEKNSVLRSYLPAGTNYNDQWVDELFAYLEELGVHCINNTQVLMEHSQKEAVFNREYDAGHWNDLGCFYATNHLLRRIHEDHAAVTELRMDEFHITEKTESHLAVSEFKISEQVPVFQLKTNFQDISSMYQGEVSVNPEFPHFYYFQNQIENAEELPKMLVFQGSFYNGRPQYLVSRTSDYIGVHNYQNVMDLDYYYNIFQPDIVVFEAAEYTLNNGFFNFAQMEQVDFNPALVNINAEQSVSKQLDTIRKEADLFSVESSVELVQGQKVDKVYVERDYSDAKYAYLLIDDTVIDLRRGMGDVFQADISHGMLRVGDSVIAYFVGSDGKTYYSPLTVERADVFSDEATLSDHAERSKHGTITFTTDVRKNAFNLVVLQIIDADNNEFLETIDSANSIGQVEGIYRHSKESGWYVLRLKANSNLADEYADCIVWLEEGRKYFYSFEVEKLKKKKVVLDGFVIYGHSEVKNRK